jgi:hypothetical protein
MVLATDLASSLPELVSSPGCNPEGPVPGLFGLVAGVGCMFLIGVPAMATLFYTSAFFVSAPMGLLRVELARRFQLAR